MEKKSLQECNAQYKAIITGLSEMHTFKYRINGSKDDTLQMNIWNVIPMHLGYVMLDEVKAFIKMHGDANFYSVKSVVAKEFLEFCTDLPQPEVADENGEMICDYTLCYELVFGRYGVAKYDRISAEFLDEMLKLVEDFYLAEIKISEPVNQLALKMRDLYELFKYELDDIAENPARMAEVLQLAIKPENQEEK